MFPLRSKITRSFERVVVSRVPWVSCGLGTSKSIMATETTIEQINRHASDESKQHMHVIVKIK